MKKKDSCLNLNIRDREIHVPMVFFYDFDFILGSVDFFEFMCIVNNVKYSSSDKVFKVINRL